VNGPLPYGPRARILPGPLTLHAWPSGRIPYTRSRRLQAWREVDREANELRDRYTGAQWAGAAIQTSAKGKWDVLVPSTMKVSVGDQIRFARLARAIVTQPPFGNAGVVPDIDAINDNVLSATESRCYADIYVFSNFLATN
jgi:hypothetical protein